MRYDEILTEMAFDRKRIIRALESYDARIFEHAVKIIVLPESQDVAGWKRELVAWCGYLSELRLKSKSGKNPPMGAELALKYLYTDPFEGNEAGMTAHFIRMAEVSHNVSLTADVEAVHARLKEFLTQIAQAIGTGGDVESVIAHLSP